MGGQAFQGTLSSAGKSLGNSGFKWNMNNKVLGPALTAAQGKENDQSVEAGREMGVIGVKSLILQARK